MKYCLLCLQPDTRPNTFFSKEGICPSCVYFSKLSKVDWDERYSILVDLLSSSKKKSSGYFDCIIGVSGGKDSMRQAIWLRDNLKMNPLLVCLSYPPEQLSNRGVNNISQLIEHGFDVVISAPSPVTWQKLMRSSFLNFTNWAKSTELALYSSVPKMAIKYGINLMFFGENPGLQLGDLKTLGNTGYDGNNLRNMNTLAGGSYKWMTEQGFDVKNILPYVYPSSKEFEKKQLQIIYLGWFLKDWSLVNNGMYSATTGLTIRKDKVNKTGDLFGVTALDEEWVTLNQMIKFYKYGFGRVTDYVNEEIRLKRMTRDEGIYIVSKYDDACDEKYIKSFCNFIKITVDQFWLQVRKSLNKDLFEIDSKGKITRKYKVGVGL